MSSKPELTYNEKAKLICEHVRPSDLHTKHHDVDLKYICDKLKDNPDHVFDHEHDQGLIDRMYPTAQRKVRRN